MPSLAFEDAENFFYAEFQEQAEVARETCGLVVDDCLEVLKAWVFCLASGNKILLFGNGGSASQAQHIATELVVRYGADRKALPAIALTADSTLLTAAGNDLGFDRIFSRQVEALGRKGDIAVGLSTSGRSHNVLSALQTARSIGMLTVALTGGDGGDIIKLADHVLCVPSRTTARIQEMHLTLGHLLCAGVERLLGLV